ncbi:unnamed protein product, partial [Mesorhabditis belari]|uniref:Uncharacterized protein n=1 Tax=Mesorhabditis belari TaxID=2138241 RepID=A0AAF3EMJ9_9BILA
MGAKHQIGLFSLFLFYSLIFTHQPEIGPIPCQRIFQNYSNQTIAQGLLVCKQINNVSNCQKKVKIAERWVKSSWNATMPLNLTQFVKESCVVDRYMQTRHFPNLRRLPNMTKKNMKTVRNQYYMTLNQTGDPNQAMVMVIALLGFVLTNPGNPYYPNVLLEMASVYNKSLSTMSSKYQTSVIEAYTYLNYSKAYVRLDPASAYRILSNPNFTSNDFLRT